MRKSNFICQIEGCERKAHSRQMCVAHYCRWKRYGDPRTGRALVGEKKAWLASILNSQDDSCILSPFQNDNRRNYWVFNECGRQISAHRWVCEQIHGQAPGGFQAAHSCGNGHLGCVNPRHLSWASVRQNNADKLNHGTQVFGEQANSAKLTESAVRRIRQLAETTTRKELAKMFGVSRRNVDHIVTGKSWRHI